MKFCPPDQNKKQKSRRQRKITWFNPPFSKNVRTNVGEKFLGLVDKCFPPAHPLRKVVNRNTVKVSYRCMPNIKKCISKHNSQASRNEETEPQNAPGCNCRAGEEQCPLDGKCLTEKVVYRATVNEGSGTVNTYTGLTSQTFKARLYSHTNSFKYRDVTIGPLCQHTLGI